jgi:uncharacterized repeat protein (TIGR03843 family)
MSAQPDLLPALEQGEIKLKGQFMLGSNYTFLVNVRHEGCEYQAVYKPQQGEQPLWDFPESSLAGREVAAYLVSEALGWGFVPLTVLRAEGPMGPGSLQQYIDYDPNYHYFNFSDDDKARLRIVSLFDLLTNNADRKGGHVIFEKRTHHLYAIDHGLCFHEDHKLRTVIWDFAGESIPADLIAALKKLRSDLSTPTNPVGASRKLRNDLSAHLNTGEIDMLNQRAESLIKNGRYPHPPRDRRAYPYPPL